MISIEEMRRRAAQYPAEVQQGWAICAEICERLDLLLEPRAPQAAPPEKQRHVNFDPKKGKR